MGRRLGVSGQAISAWTRGETKPSSDSLAAIARTYPDLRTEWLLLGQGPPRAASPGAGLDRAEGSPGARSPRSTARQGPGLQDEPASSDERYLAGWRDALSRLRSLLGQLEPET